jgi:hypothetical protein
MSEPPDAEVLAEITTQSPGGAAARRTLYHRRGRHWRGRPVSVVVVVAIIGGAIVLVRSHVAPSAASGSWLGGTPVTREAEAGGLYFVMQVTPGPYFLGELLGATLSLTNYSPTSYTWEGPPVAGRCGGAVNLNANGGTAPYYSLPYALVGSHCVPGTTQLSPGATLTLFELVPLTSSGEVTLLPQGDVLQTFVYPDGVQTGNWTPSPLEGHWPSLNIAVSSTTPWDRRITAQAEASQLRIGAPPPALSHLFYIYAAVCISSSGEGAGTFNYWEPVSTTTLHEPECDSQTGPNLRWSYAVSAPGYSIASGQVG